MAETETRAAQDIGQDEAYVCNLKNVVDTHFNIGKMGLEQLQRDLTAMSQTTITNLQNTVATNQRFFDGMMEITLKNARASSVAQEHNANQMINVDEQALAVKDVYADPMIDAIAARVVELIQKQVIPAPV